MSCFIRSTAAMAAGMLLCMAAMAAPVVYTDESAFRSAAASTAAYGFETHGLTEELYLPSPISASDLDGHFDLAYTNLNAFSIWDSAGSPYLSEGTHFLFTHSGLAADSYTLTFSNFGGSNDAITAFGITIIDFASNLDPKSYSTITYDTGGLTGLLFDIIGLQPDYTQNFLGLIVDAPEAFTSITLTMDDLHSGFQSFDGVLYSQNPIPEPSTLLLLALGLTGLAAYGKGRLRG